tara:strand:+ start:197 stop:826 length:630 start_codon:yes stop_codon:yes gene_type:complete
MQIETNFTYAFGSPTELNEGDFNSMLTSDELGGIVEARDLSDISKPNFIGIYQDSNFAFAPMDNDDLNAQVNFAMNGAQFHGYLIGQGSRPDKMHPNLIHVAFKAPWNFWNVKEALGNPSGRIGVSSYDNLPRFENKDVDLYQRVSRENMEEPRSGFDSREIREQIREQMHRFGLTNSEYLLMQSLDKEASVLTLDVGTLSRARFELDL